MSLKELRQEVDMLDIEIIKVLGRRIEIVRQIAQVKKENQLPIFDEKREEEIRREVRKHAKIQGLSAEMMLEIMQLILDYSRIEMGAV